MKNTITKIITAALLLATFGTGCPKNTNPHDQPPQANPLFFRDSTPQQGPWTVNVKTDESTYQKLYVHKSQDAIIAATFVKTEETPDELDVTDPRNQQALAENALGGFCKSIEAQCVVDSADIAWIVGTTMKYVYVRFRAEKKNVPLMTGLIYYRFDPPFQTMYLLVADQRVYDGFETAFLNYVSGVEFNPEKIR